MLNALDKLSGVAVDTVDRSQQQLVADLQQLAPTLKAIAQAGDNLPKSLQVLVTYPFTDYTVNDVKGDYFNADVKVNLDLSSVLSDVANASTPVIPLPDNLSGTASQAPLPAATTPSPPARSSGGIAGGVSGLLNLLLGGGSS